jgi:hypothetical protein
LETNLATTCGSILTFEHEEDARKWGFDKVIMQAGGIGYGKLEQAIKKHHKQETNRYSGWRKL